MLYFAFVQSILQYGIIAWGSANKTHLILLKTTQNIILRVILNKHNRFSSNLLYKEFKVFDIVDLYKYKILYFMNKDEYHSSVQKIDSNTRQNGQAMVITVNKSIILRHYIYVSSILLNKLPSEFTTIPPILLKNKFKGSFMQFFNSNCYPITRTLLELEDQTLPLTLCSQSLRMLTTKHIN